MTDYIEFIDSPAIRNHLRTLPPLPPAQQCILIAQSEIRSLEEKLAALREIRAVTSQAEFSRGCWRFQSDDPFLWGDMPASVVMRKAVPGLPVNLFIPCIYHVQPVSIRVQRSVADEPNYRDAVEMTLEAEPQFVVGIGDLSPAEVDAVSDFVVRNLGPLLSYWNEKITFDDLLTTLRKKDDNGNEKGRTEDSVRRTDRC